MQKLNSSERAHHPYSPSSLQMREGCPKFEQREGAVHEMAKVGSKQHDSVDSKLDDPSLPDYRAAAVVECIAFAEERLKAYPGGVMLKEEYLPVDDVQILNPEWVAWQVTKKAPQPRKLFLGTTAGYLDIGIVSADETAAEIIDWKFGNNAVEPAVDNVQGISYALGMFRRYPKLKSITVRFIMPHLDYTTEHTFTVDDFPGMMLRVRTIVNRAIEAKKDSEDFSMATPNPSSCLFCGLIGRCPKVADIAIKLGKKYRPLELPENITPSTISNPKDASIGIKLAAIVSTWAEAFRRQATARTVEDPDFIPDGYVLVESQRRIVAKAKNLGDIAKGFIPAEHHGMVEALYDVPIGELEKLISTYAARGNKEKTVEDFGKKAIAEGALELGKPFAFLRLNRVQDGNAKSAPN